MDEEDQSIQVSDADVEYRWSADIRVELHRNTASLLSSENRIQFFPDGTATSAVILVSAGNGSHEIFVDWLTGRIRVV